MIAIIIPSRGFIFTDVISAIEDEKKYFYDEVKIFTCSLQIPDSFNILTEKALAEGATHLWYIEEDTVPVKGSLRKLIFSSADIAFVDYGVNGYSCSAKDKLGKILWAGLGCTMVKSYVFEKLDKPWFRTDKSLRLNDMKWTDNKMGYGGQDIYFYTKAKEAGFKIEQIMGECRHLKLESMGKSEINNGLHKIVEKPKISKYQIINL